MDLSVIIASIDARRSLDECIRRLTASCAGLHAELIIVDGSGDAGDLQFTGSLVRVVRAQPGLLTPELWAEGYRRSTGRIVAFTTAHCLATPDWAASLVAALDSGAAGAGGPLIVGPGTSPLDWAVFYLRYSAFMPATLGTGRIEGEIAGDNAAYRRSALEPHERAFAQGFWEIEVHKLLRADGGWLVAVPGAVMEFGRAFRFNTIAAHRFEHGRQFGAERVRRGRSAWLQFIAAPIVPFLLAGRAALRVRRSPGDAGRYVVALPWLLALGMCWAAGEAWGGLRGVPVHQQCPQRAPRNADSA